MSKSPSSSVGKKNDKYCHQCRQNTIDLTVSCKAECTLIFCRKCQLKRYGVKAEEIESLEDWSCPRCRGKCNCSICMKKKGLEPTGKLELWLIQERMAGKSAEKSPVRRDDSRKKTGNKVHFDSEDSIDGTSPLANERVNASAAEDEKWEEIANGVLETAEEVLPELEIPKQSTCIMDSEAAEMLFAIQERMPILSQDPDIRIPVSFDMGLSYAKRDGNNVKSQAIMKIFKPLKKHGVSDSEICQIANVGPESVDEVFALIPTLKLKMSEIREPLRIAWEGLAYLNAASANPEGSI